jgi:hypothetical protein
MAGLKFEADLKETISDILKLKNGINELKKSLLEVAGVPNSGAAVKKLEDQIAKAMVKMEEYRNKYTQLKKAYDDLNSSNAAVVKVHEETKALQSVNQWLVANIKAVQDSDAKVQQLRKQFETLTAEEKTGEKGYGILLQVQQQVAVRKKEEESIRKNIKAQKDQIIQSESEEGSITNLRKQLTQLIITYDNMGRVRREGGAGKALLAQIKVIQNELSAAEQASGRFQRNVGNYSSAFNGLGMSIQQIARELPSLTIGINMFFLAISNNLPIFVDEIQKARKEYSAYLEELRKGNTEAKKIAPVWKQVASSLFSWQTALVVGITLLTAYGKEIFNWVGNLVSGKKAVLDLLSAEQEMALARNRAIENIKKEQIQLDLLYNKLKNTTISDRERLAVSNEWLKRYPQYANVLNGEKINLENLGLAYKALSKEIYASAVARSYADKVAELSIKKDQELTKARNQYVTYLKAQEEYNSAQNKYNKLQEEYNKGKSVGQSLSDLRTELPYIKENINKQKQLWLDIRANVKQYDKDIETISNHIDAFNLFPQPKEGTFDYWQQQKTNADKALKEIRSDIKNTLDAATKDNKDLFSLGIDESTVKVYQKAISDIAEANKQLEVYSDKTVDPTSKLNAISSQEDKISQLRQKQAIERKRQEEDLEYQAAQARIDAMAEGSEKVQAQMRLDHEREIQEIQRQKQEYIRARIQEEKEIFDAQEELKAKEDKKYKKKTFDASTVTVDTSIFEKITKATIERQGNDLAEYYKEVLAKYQDYTTKRLDAKKKFDADLKKLEESGGTEAQKAELEYQREETYKAIDSEFAMREDTFQSWADGIADMALEQLRNLLVNAEKELERMEFLNPNNPQLAVQRAKVASLEEAINKKETGTSPDKRSKKEWQDLYNTLSKVEREFDKIGKTVGGTAGEILSAAGGITTSTLQMIDGIVQVSDSSSWSMLATATAAEKAIKMVENASVILAIIGAALQIATKIASLFGNSSMEYYESLKDELGAINEIYGDIIEKSKEKIVFGGGFSSLESYKEANDLLERQIENYRKLAEAGGNARPTGAHSYVYRANKRLSGRSASGKSGVEAGKGRFEDISKVLGKNITKVQDLYNLTGEELYLVQTKFPEAWSKIPEEITDSLQAIIDCREESEKLRDALNEAITGVSFDSFYNEFIDMLSDMDMSAEDMAENFGEYLRKSILAAMVAKNFQEDINELYDKWVAAGKEDSLGGMTITEDEARDIQDEYKKLVDAMVQARDNMSQAFGWDSSATSQDSSSRGFQTMSQDTADELNGRFTALQVAGEETKNQSIITNDWLAKIHASISATYKVPDIAGEARNVAVNSVQPQFSVVFPTKQIESIAYDVSTLKGIVDEVRTLQANANMEREIMSETASTGFKKMVNGLSDVKKTMDNKL